MKLIVGLGNIGKEYQATRHNLGFMVLDLLAGEEMWNNSKNAQAMYLKKDLNGQTAELLKPTTLMNNSGLAVSYAAKKHLLNAEDILAVYDDLDLPLGNIRIGIFNSSGGHNGVQSIIDHLHSNQFIRLRIGIKPLDGQKEPAEKFVLKKFDPQEKKIINQSIAKAVQAIQDIMAEPLKQVMGKYN